MAVIQDLPAETLYRILELGAEDPDCFRGRDLCSTALVARAWRQPSQELLVYEWWSPHLSKSYDTPPLPARRVRYTLIHSLEAAAGARRLIERHGTLLSRLDVYSDRSASDLNFLLLKGTSARSPLPQSSLTEPMQERST